MDGRFQISIAGYRRNPGVKSGLRLVRIFVKLLIPARQIRQANGPTNEELSGALFPRNQTIRAPFRIRRPGLRGWAESLGKYRGTRSDVRQRAFRGVGGRRGLQGGTALAERSHNLQ